MTKDEAQRRRWTFYEAVVLSMSVTSGKAGGLKYVNRSKRLKTGRHLKVATTQKFLADRAFDPLLPVS
jgi:hypothetical protein